MRQAASCRSSCVPICAAVISLKVDDWTRYIDKFLLILILANVRVEALMRHAP